MASNFKIIRYQKRENLHLKLIGDFDGTSAYELMNTLTSSKVNKGKIFIHTDDLKSVYLFGAELFKLKCPRIISRCIIFTGKRAVELVYPEMIPV